MKMVLNEEPREKRKNLAGKLLAGNIGLNRKFIYIYGFFLNFIIISTWNVFFRFYNKIFHFPIHIQISSVILSIYLSKLYLPLAVRILMLNFNLFWIILVTCTYINTHIYTKIIRQTYIHIQFTWCMEKERCGWSGDRVYGNRVWKTQKSLYTIFNLCTYLVIVLLGTT